jgi:hypothetical protein
MIMIICFVLLHQLLIVFTPENQLIKNLLKEILVITTLILNLLKRCLIPIDNKRVMSFCDDYH